MSDRTLSSCEGEYLRIKCPEKTVIVVQEAMYGRKVPSAEMCPLKGKLPVSPAALTAREDVNCEAVTSLTKTASVCEGRRICQLLVFNRVFGKDPCPTTSKYLTVVYKCRIMADELKSTGTCKEAFLRIRCSRSQVVAIYNVTVFNSTACGANADQKGCNSTSDDVLNHVTKRCHKQRKCVIRVFPTKCGNYIRVQHTCVPRDILTDQVPSSALSSMQPPVAIDEIIETSTNGSTTSLPLSPETTADVILPPVVPVVDATVSVDVTSTELTRSTSESAREGSSHVVTTATLSKRYLTVVANSNPSYTERPSNKSSLPENNPATTTTSTTEIMTSNSVSSSTIFFERSGKNTTMVSGDNSTLSAGISFLTEVIKIISFIQENPDRALVVVLSSVCVCLFLTIIFLACRCDQRKIDNGKTERTTFATQRPQDDFTTALDGAATHHSHEYTNQVRSHRRKKRSRTQTLLNKWCTCCCTNAPWQRDHSDSEGSSHGPPRSTSLSDDGMISAGRERHRFDETITAFPSSMQQEADRRDVEPRELDNTSEYEFQDEMVLPADPLLSPSTSHVAAAPVQDEEPRTFTQGVFSAPLRTSFQRANVLNTYEHPREPPPFPKPISYGYPLQPSPYVNNRTDYDQPRSHYHTQERHQQAYLSSYNEHYVALRHLPSERSLNLRQLEARSPRRDSFYDNSLPRDSPIYEYYQRQRTRQELPGTRNINHYYS